MQLKKKKNIFRVTHNRRLRLCCALSGVTSTASCSAATTEESFGQRNAGPPGTFTGEDGRPGSAGPGQGRVSSCGGHQASVDGVPS